MFDRDQISWFLSQVLFAEHTALVVEWAEWRQVVVRDLGRVCELRKLRVQVGKCRILGEVYGLHARWKLQGLSRSSNLYIRSSTWMLVSCNEGQGKVSSVTPPLFW